MPHGPLAKDPARLAVLTRYLLIAQAALAVITLSVEGVYLNALAGTTPSGYPSDPDVDAVGQWLVLLYNTQLFAFLVGGGLFVAWLYRVYSNLRPLGAVELRYTEGWTIGSWFVPILGLIRPLQLVNDTWRASDPSLPVMVARGAWERARVPALLPVWWIVFSLFTTLTVVFSAMRPEYFTLESDRSTTIASAVTNVLTLAAALLAVQVVALVTERQRARAAAREQMQPPPGLGPPPPAPAATSLWAAP